MFQNFEFSKFILSAQKINVFKYVLLLYSWVLFAASKLMYKCCKFMINYVPDMLIPDVSPTIWRPIFANDGLYSESIKIDNIQCDTKDITKKIKLLLWLYNDNDLKTEGKLVLSRYIKFIEKCSLIFIDYQIQTKFGIHYGEKIKDKNGKFNRRKVFTKDTSFDSENQEIENKLIKKIIEVSFAKDTNASFAQEDVKLDNNAKVLSSYKCINLNGDKIEIPFGEIKL